MISVGVVAAGLLAAVSSTAVRAAADDNVYVPYSGIENGTDGVAPVDMQLRNGADGEMVCTVSFAHWYSTDLGPVAPGAVIAATLWHDGETGTLSMLNATRDRMPVEAITCGLKDHLGATRKTVALPIRSGATPEAVARRCVQARNGRLDCDGRDH